jgi:hypothetical protein
MRVGRQGGIARPRQLGTMLRASRLLLPLLEEGSVFDIGSSQDVNLLSQALRGQLCSSLGSKTCDLGCGKSVLYLNIEGIEVNIPQLLSQSVASGTQHLGGSVTQEAKRANKSSLKGAD